MTENMKKYADGGVDNCHIQKYEDKVVFTTLDRSVAVELDKFVDGANVTEAPGTSEPFHYQGWIDREAWERNGEDKRFFKK